MKKTLIALVTTTLFIVTMGQASAADGANLALISDTDTVSVGDTFTVQVMLDTAGATTDDVDVSISYDPLMLEVQDGMPDLTDSESVSEDVSLLEVYIENVIDAPKGKIFFEQTSLDPDKYYTSEDGAEVLAEFKVRALAAGTAEMTLELTEGEDKSDSSVMDAESQKDILAEVSNLVMTIKGDNAEDTVAEKGDAEKAPMLATLDLESSATKVSTSGDVDFTVVAKDEGGNPVADESLLFSASNDAQLSTLTGTTDANGEATFSMTAPEAAGTVQVQVYSSANAALSAMVTVEVMANETTEVVGDNVDKAESPMVPETVSAGPDALNDVGTGSVMIALSAAIAMILAVTLNFRKEN